LTLDASARRRLLGAITVLDSTSQVSDLSGRLRAALGLVVPSERPMEFLERLQGWWVGRSALLLSGGIPQVSGADLYRYCDSLRDEFRRGTLTVTEELYTDPTESQKAPLEDKVFIRQLKMVSCWRDREPVSRPATERAGSAAESGVHRAGAGFGRRRTRSTNRTTNAHWTVCFLTVPIALHAPTRMALPRKVTTKPGSWLEQHPLLRAGFAGRARTAAPAVRAGLREGLRAGALELSGESIIGTPPRRLARVSLSVEAEDILKRPELETWRSTPVRPRCARI
jgi:hypothetical protein